MSSEITAAARTKTAIGMLHVRLKGGVTQGEERDAACIMIMPECVLQHPSLLLCSRDGNTATIVYVVTSAGCLSAQVGDYGGSVAWLGKQSRTEQLMSGTTFHMLSLRINLNLRMMEKGK